MDINEIIQTLKEITNRYGLKILYFDYTDITIISRIGISLDIFIQMYANIKKEKVNMALVVAGERIYGVDKEDDSYHEHPFEDPSLHVDTEKIDIEDFVIKRLGILKGTNLI